ncbi:DUF2190 family protein [Candidatus Sumerlaeota bacterium]|nr:DUF2190 family protein [Candidatus Sumerlaeota bacterium]
MGGYPMVVYTAKNIGSGSLDAGTAVFWAGVDSGVLCVEELGTSVAASTPFAGIVLTGGAGGAMIEVARSGVMQVPASGAFSIGDELTWDGSTMTTGGTPIAFALEEHSGSSDTLIMLSGRW